MDTIDRAAVVSAFCEECVWVRSIRKHFSDLFESSDQRSRLLREAAGMFFHDLNQVLIEYILLQQCKLTDPASSRSGSENLTSNLILQLDWSKATKTSLEDHNEKMQQFRKKILGARHKLVGHLDLRSRLGTHPLGDFSPEEESEFWCALQAFVNAAHDEAIGGPYEIDVAMPQGDAMSLVRYLEDAADYNDLAESEPGFLQGRYPHRRYANT